MFVLCGTFVIVRLFFAAEAVRGSCTRSPMLPSCVSQINTERLVAVVVVVVVVCYYVYSCRLAQVSRVFVLHCAPWNSVELNFSRGLSWQSKESLIIRTIR